MLQFKKILMPTDFGAASDRALEVAVDFANKYDAQLLLLHVYPLPTAIYGMYAMTVPPSTLAADVEQAARVTLDQCLARITPRVANVEAVLRMGEPWDEIIRASKDLGADLIVIGTHGHRGLSRLFLGSVAEKVVRLASVPVFTVRAPDEPIAEDVDGRLSGVSVERGDAVPRAPAPNAHAAT
jgi:nucleotide-binding universal stress UspA family protein